MEKSALATKLGVFEKKMKESLKKIFLMILFRNK